MGENSPMIGVSSFIQFVAQLCNAAPHSVCWAEYTFLQMVGLLCKLAAQSSGQNSVVLVGPVSRHLPTRQFSSSATTGMGENSPTTYGLQGSSKTWVNFYPGCTVH